MARLTDFHRQQYDSTPPSPRRHPRARALYRPPHFPSNHALTAVSPLPAAPLSSPPERRLLRSSPSQPAPQAHPLGPVEPPWAAPCQPRAASSPERVLQRREPVGATAHPRRSPDRAIQPRQSTLGEPLVSTAPLVGQARPAIVAGEPTRRWRGTFVAIEIFPGLKP
jgi:hypothetical protein